MSISQQAIEAAARVLFEREHGQSVRWGDAPQPLRRQFRGDAEAALNAAKVSTEWGWRRRTGGDVRLVPAAFTAADVYHKLQEDGRTWQGVKYQIVSREVTAWELRETVAKTEGGINDR